MTKPDKLNNRTSLTSHFIYYNLHKRCWSLKALRTAQPHFSGSFAPSVKGRVTGHADTILACGTTTKISEAGRQRVIREKRKNVHAGIICTSCIVEPSHKLIATDATPSMTYNPYKAGYFYDRASGEIVTDAPYVLMRSGCDDGPPRVYYGKDLYYAYWTDENGSINTDRITGFISKGDLYRWIGWADFTGFVRRVSHPFGKYLICDSGSASYAI